MGRNEINEWIEDRCAYCGDIHSCRDLDGDMIEGQVKICMDANKEEDVYTFDEKDYLVRKKGDKNG